MANMTDKNEKKSGHYPDGEMKRNMQEVYCYGN
jgi:hypothetical protein